MEIVLERYPSGETETQGRLRVGGMDMFTLEQELRVTKKYPYGVPANSCVPFGRYSLEPFERPNGEKTWCLINPDLGVYFSPDQRTDVRGRYYCLIHKGNFSYHTEGCILPGMQHKQLYSPKKARVMPAVAQSTKAMELLRNVLGEGSTGHTLLIIPATGWVI